MQTLEKNIDDPVWRDDIKKILKSLRGRELDRRQIGRETGLRYYLKVQNRLIDLVDLEYIQRRGERYSTNPSVNDFADLLKAYFCFNRALFRVIN